MGAAAACFLDANDAPAAAVLHAATASALPHDHDAAAGDDAAATAHEPFRPCHAAVRCSGYSSATRVYRTADGVATLPHQTLTLQQVHASHVHAVARHATPFLLSLSIVQLFAP